MRRLVVDIEVIGEKWEDIDHGTQEMLAKNIPYEPGSEEYEREVETIQGKLGLSPLTGEIVAIGVLDVEKEQGVVYFQAGEKTEEMEPFEEASVAYKPVSEREMLVKFWEGVKNYQEFITYNGRGFDFPYIIARSGVHKVKVSKDLMSHRYLSMMRPGQVHVDLQEQFAYYGAVWKPGSLHLWCRALGITSPKEEGVAGDAVGEMYENGQYKEIALYNGRDLWATKALYERWRDYMRP